jgi:hypothetical protein
MERLKGRAESLQPGGATKDAVLAASVFGLWVLPIGSFPFLTGLFPMRRPGERRPGSDCGTSYGGASSCGGGGCGGGCGGCGSE